MENNNDDWIDSILDNYVDETLKEKINGDFIEFILGKSQNDRVLFYFKHENNISNKELKEIFLDLEINTITKRLSNSGLIEVADKEGKSFIFNITNKGSLSLSRKVKSFLEKNYDYKDDLIEKRKKVNSPVDKKVKVMTDAIIEAGIRPNLNDKIMINLSKLTEYHPQFVDLVYTDYLDALDMLKILFKDDIDKEIEDEDIIFTNVHQSEFRPIHDFDREYKGLVYTKGLITTKKEQIKSKTMLFIYRCENEECTHHKNKLTCTQELRKDKNKGICICPRCKGALLLEKEKRINQLESKIVDIDTGIAFSLYVRNDLCKTFPKLELGDQIEVSGFLEDKIIESKMGVKEIEKVLVINHFKTTDYVTELTKEELHEVNQFLDKTDKYDDFLLSPFESYIEDDIVKKLFIIQQLTKWDPKNREVPINIAMMGEPGVGKNVLIKIAETYFPTCDGIVGADITDAGFKGTVNRDTGIKEVGLAKKCQGGTLFFNEFDKFVKSNINGKKGASQLLNATITEQEIRLNKAGIRIRMSNLDLRHNVIFNPLDEKILGSKKIPYDSMGDILDKSLLSRMVPLYIKQDQARSEKVFDLMLTKNNSTTKINPESYKLVIRHLRSLEVQFTDKAKDLLRNIYSEFIRSTKFQAISVERIGQMLTQISKGVTRFNGKTKCGVEEVKMAHKIYMYCLSSVGVDMDNLEHLIHDNSSEDIKEITMCKEYVISHLSKNKVLDIVELSKIMSSLKKENITKVITSLTKTGEYYELPMGKLRKND